MARKLVSVADRMREKVEINSSTGCWNWTASKNRGGYGIIKIDGKSQLAHRVSYATYKDEMPTWHRVLHRCDNPACINPDHLFSGTQAENVADKVSKGRQARGTQIQNSKLKESDVLAIKSSAGMNKKIAKKYGIGTAQVYRIRSGKQWSHLG